VLRSVLSHVDANADAMPERYSELMPARTAGSSIAEKQFCATAWRGRQSRILPNSDNPHLTIRLFAVQQVPVKSPIKIPSTR
jgi:hypothetical protein